MIEINDKGYSINFGSFQTRAVYGTCWILLQIEQKDKVCVVACWSQSLCSSYLRLKIVRKILSRSAMETGLDRRHSSIISTPHTPTTFVHIHSSFLNLSYISNLTIPPSYIQSNKTQAGHCFCFRWLLFQICYMLW